jgi:hypothetical protein
MPITDNECECAQCRRQLRRQAVTWTSLFGHVCGPCHKEYERSLLHRAPRKRRKSSTRKREPLAVDPRQLRLPFPPIDGGINGD